MGRAAVEVLEWAPVGVIYDPKKKNRVIMRLFYSVKDRKWAYSAYTGVTEKMVTKDHCMRQAQNLILETDYVGNTRYVGRINWKDKNKEVETVCGH